MLHIQIGNKININIRDNWLWWMASTLSSVLDINSAVDEKMASN